MATDGIDNMKPFGAAVGQQSAGTLLLVIWGAEVLQAFLSSRLLGFAGQLILCIYLVVALTRAAPHLIAVCVTLLLAAATMLWQWGRYEGLERGLQSSFHFAAFFAALQYLRELALRIPEVRYTRMAISRAGPAAMKMTFLLFGHLIGSVFAAGSLVLLGSMAPANSDSRNRISNARSAVLGVGTAIAWSPLFVAMALVSSLTPNVQVWQLMAMGAPPALLVIGSRCLQIWVSDRVDLGLIWSSFLSLQKLIIPLIASVALLTSVTGRSNLTIVALLVPCIALLAAWTKRNMDLLAIGRSVQIDLSRTRDEVLLVSVALIVGHTGASAPEAVILSYFDGIPQMSRAAYIALSALVVFSGSFVGLHPLLTTSLTLPIIHGLADEVCPPLAISAAALVGWSAASIVSLWAVPVLVASHSFRVPLARLSRGPNLLCAILYLLVGIGFITFVSNFM